MNRVVASLALVKALWDNTEDRRDYLQNFVPFVATLFNQKAYTKVKVSVICKDFQQVFGFSIAYHPMVTILDRMRTAGLIQKHANGIFVPIKEAIKHIDFTDIALEQERKYDYVLKQFIDFCSDKYEEEITKEDAEQIFVAFVKNHDIDLLFMNAKLHSLLPSTDVTPSQRYLVYKFVHDAYESDPAIFRFILDYTVGHIFANLLIYQHEALELEQSNLANCKIYLDTAFLFNLTGINGDEFKDAYLEFVEALRNQKAELFIFRHTFDEFRGIVEGSLAWIDNKYYDPYRASRATVFFVDNGYRSSDVEQFILDIDSKIQSFGISIIESPDPQDDTEYQIDENALRQLIVDIYKARDAEFNEYDKEFTIDRDVKSIAYVHKLRAGVRPTRILDATNAFVTTNSALAVANKRLEESQDTDQYFHIPVVLTDVFLGTVIWLNSPTVVSTLNEKRLVAVCYSALQPSRELLKMLADKADQLLVRGEISSDEVALLKQSRVARNLLQDETRGDPNRFTDKTAFDILKEIRWTIKREEREDFEQERAQINAENQELRTTLEITTSSAQSFERTVGQYNARHELLAAKTAILAVRLFYALSAVVVVYITAMQFSQDIAPKNTLWKIIFIIFAIFLSVINLLIGTNVRDVGVWLKKYIKQKVITILQSA